MMKLIDVACTLCNYEKWQVIEPYLESWGYDIVAPGKFLFPRLVVLNLNGQFGTCTDLTDSVEARTAHNRCFVENIDEFLTCAAEYKGYIYDNKSEIFTKDDLKSGMVVEIADGTQYMVIGNNLVGTDESINLYFYDNNLKDNIRSKYDIMRVYDISNNWEKGLRWGIQHGEILWSRKVKKKISKKEIAKKFGVPVDMLEIVE